MKLKKVVAGILTAAVILTSVSDIGLLTYAAEDVTTEDATEEDTKVKDVTTEEETLKSLLEEAEAKYQAATEYSAASRQHLKTVANESGNAVESSDEGAITTAKNYLKDALDALEKLYKVQIQTGTATVEVTPGDDGEVHMDTDGNKIIYVPVSAEVTATASQYDADDNVFVAWMADGQGVCTNLTYKFTVTGDQEISLQYKEDKDPDVSDLNLSITAKWNESVGKFALLQNVIFQSHVLLSNMAL